MLDFDPENCQSYAWQVKYPLLHELISQELKILEIELRFQFLFSIQEKSQLLLLQITTLQLFLQFQDCHSASQSFALVLVSKGLLFFVRCFSMGLEFVLQDPYLINLYFLLVQEHFYLQSSSKVLLLFFLPMAMLFVVLLFQV